MHTKRMILPAAILFAAALMVFCFPFMQKHESKNAAQPVQPDGASIILPPAGGETLFPDLSAGAITSVAVHADSCAFDFLIDSRGAVSVNGRRADSEIFDTLIAQITELPVVPLSAFSPAQEPVMTLIIRSGEREHVARFYEGGEKGEDALILAGSSDAPRYRQTDGWRIGTLLMTCEGTRIQDERGNEPLPD